MKTKKTQINLYVSEDLGARMDKLIEEHNASALFGRIGSRGELVEAMVTVVEQYQRKNGEISSFFNLLGGM